MVTGARARGAAWLRFVTVTVTGNESTLGRCTGKDIDEGLTVIPSTFPSRVNNELGYPGSAGTMLTEVTGVPITRPGVTELPI